MKTSLALLLLALAAACGPHTAEGADLAATPDLRKVHDLASANDDLAGADMPMVMTDMATVDSATPADMAVLPPDLLGCTPPVRSDVMYVAAITKGNGLFTAQFTSASWTGAATTTALSVTDVVGARLGGRVAWAGRASDSSVFAAVDDPCTYAATAPQAIGNAATTPNRPAVAATTSALDVVFRGSVSNDHRYYWSAWNSVGFDAPTTQGNLLAVLPPRALYKNDVLHVVFTADDNHLYDGVPDKASGGSAQPISTASSPHPPAAVELADHSLLVVFTGNDTNVYFSRSDATDYAAPKQLCEGQSSCLIATNLPPALGLDKSGKPQAIWAGKDSVDGSKNKGLYASTFDAGNNTWSAATQVTDEVVDTTPAVATGIDTAALEVVYVRGGDNVLRHARLITTWQTPATIDAGEFMTTPALVTF